MIKLDITTALFIYLFFSAVIMLILWSFFDFGTGLKTYSSDEKYIWHCAICDFTYIDSKSDEFSECVRCASIVQRDVTENADGQDKQKRKIGRG